VVGCGLEYVRSFQKIRVGEKTPVVERAEPLEYRGEDSVKRVG